MNQNNSSAANMNNLQNTINFEQEFLQNEITDEIQLMQTAQTQRQGNTFISMIKHITTNNKRTSTTTAMPSGSVAASMIPSSTATTTTLLNPNNNLGAE